MSNTNIQDQTIDIKNLKVVLQRKPWCMIHLNIKVDPAAVLTCYSDAVKVVNKEVSIPGFRAGKAPKHIMEQRFDQHIKSEWHNIVLNYAFSEYLGHSKLYPFQKERSLKKAEVKSISKENGAELVIEYEAAPVVPDIDYSSLHISPVEKRLVTDENVEHTLHQIRLHHSEWEQVIDRPVQDGDYVDLDIEALENPPRSICKDMRFEVAPREMGEWMRKLIMGKSVNDTVEGVSEKDEALKDLSASEFVPTHCRITVKGIWKSELPPLDDALAAKTGVTTVEELKTKVREDLENQATEEQRNKQRGQVESLILESYQFDIPSSIIEVQKKEILSQRLEDLKKHEHSPEKLKEMTKEVEKSVLDELLRAYRLYFIIQKVASKENVHVYESEIFREAFIRLSEQGQQAHVMNILQDEEVRSKLYANVLTRKVLDFILDKMK